MEIKNIKKKYIIFWFIFAVALTKATFFSKLGFGLLDEGESLQNASRILLGQIPYRDFFAIFPPGDNYFFAFIFRLFGPSVLYPRIVMSIIFSFAPSFMFLILYKYSSRFLSTMFPLLVIFIDLNVERLYFFTPIFISIYLIETNPFFSGFLLGLISLVRFDLPGTFLVGMVAMIILKGWSNKKSVTRILQSLFYISIGYLIPIIFTLLWMKNNNILNLFVKSTFVDSVLVTKLHDLPFPSIFTIIPTSFSLKSFSTPYEVLYAYLVILIYIVFFFYLIRYTKKDFQNKYFLVGVYITGILSLPYVFGRSDMGHIVKGSMPALFLGSHLITKIKNYSFVKLFFLLIISLVFTANIFQSIWWIRFNDSKLEIDSYDLRINSQSIGNSTSVSKSSLKRSVEFLKTTNQDEKVLALPYMAGLYFLANRQPPNKFNNVLAGFITSEKDQQMFIQSIKEAKINRIVYARELGPKMKNNKLYQYNPLIDKYIMSNYQIVEKTSDGWLLMKRK